MIHQKASQGIEQVFNIHTVHKALLTFIEASTKRVCLLRGDLSELDCTTILQCLEPKQPIHFSLDDIYHESKLKNILIEIPISKQPLIIFTALNNVNCLDNYYYKYHLEQWEAKVIFLYNDALLHVTLDPSVYFAPLAGNKILRHLFIQITLPSSKAKRPDVPDMSPKLEPEKSSPSHLDMTKHYLNQKLMSKDNIAMQMLADRALQHDSFKAILFSWVTASRGNKELAILAANAITALTYARISYSAMDLSGIDITGADLSNALLDHTDLTEANLTNVVLHKAFIRKTKFVRSVMLGVDLGEQSDFKHPGKVMTLCLSSDKELLVTANDTNVYLWHWPQKKCIIQLEGDINDVSCVAITSDRTVIIAGTWAGTVLSWDVSTGKLKNKIIAHSKAVTGIGITPDNKLFVTSSQDETLAIRHIVTGEIIRKLHGHKGWVNCLCLSPDGKMVVSGGFDMTIKIWDVYSGKLINTLISHQKSVIALIFTTDGKRLISSSADESYKIWLTNTGSLIRTIEGEKNDCLSLSEDNRFLAAGGWDNVNIIDIELGEICSTFQGHTGQINHVTFFANDQLLLSACEDGFIKTWEVQHTTTNRPYKGHGSTIRNAFFNPQATCIATVSDDGKLRLLNTDKGDILCELSGHESIIPCVAFSANGKQVAAGCLDKTIKVYDVINGKLQSILISHTGNILCLNISHDNQYLISGDLDDCIKLWHLPSATLLNTYKIHQSSISSVCFSQDDKYFLSGSWDKTVKLCRTQTGQVLHTFKGHTKSITCVGFSHNGSLFASCSSDGVIYIYDFNTCDILHKITGHAGEVNCIDFSHDNQHIVSCGDDKTIKIWDLNTGKLIDTLNGHISRVNCVRYHPHHNQQLISGSADQSLKLWEYKHISKKAHWCVKWSTDTYLFCEGVEVQQAKHLSSKNHELLAKRAEKSINSNFSLQPK